LVGYKPALDEVDDWLAAVIVALAGFFSDKLLREAGQVGRASCDIGRTCGVEEAGGEVVGLGGVEEGS
jgi:hypothetical protein